MQGRARVREKKTENMRACGEEGVSSSSERGVHGGDLPFFSPFLKSRIANGGAPRAQIALTALQPEEGVHAEWQTGGPLLLILVMIRLVRGSETGV